MARSSAISTFALVACLVLVQAEAQIDDVLDGMGAVMPSSSGTSSHQEAADCTGLKLTAASGVPDGNVHEYKFNGTCQKFIEHKSDSKGSYRSDEVTLLAEATAIWNGKDQTLSEMLTFRFPNEKTNFGGVVSNFKCPQDPLVYKVKCAVTHHSNSTNWYGFSDAALKQQRPILRGKTTLAQAMELSKKQASAAPSPPASSRVAKAAGAAMGQKPETAPPPQGGAPATARVAQAAAAAMPRMFTVEAEQLLQAQKATVNGGQMTARPVVGGSGTQLFWHGGAVGAVLDLQVDVAAPSKYAVELYFTRGPEYANLQIEIDGQQSPVAFSGFAPSVMAPAPTQAGTFSLQPGARSVSFMISGKYQDATDYIVGIDRIVFYPAGPP